MSERLSPLDGTFLELEQADPSANMNIGAVLVFEPPADRSAPALEDVRDLVGARLPALPRFRRRLSHQSVTGVRWPEWISVEVDPADHVRRAALPSPCGLRELLDWAAEWWSVRLDRDRPLWEVTLIDGLADGRWALVTKTHHALIDGVGSVDAGTMMLDLDAAPAGGGPLARREPDEAGQGGILHALGAGAHAAAHAVRHPDRVLERSRALLELVIKDEVIAAPHASINGPIGPRRRYEAIELSLAELKAVKASLGGTVNDAVLAVVTGGLRALLEAREEHLPEQGLRAMVPVNLRPGEDRSAMGNKITSLFVHLPVAAATPLLRYARLLEEAESLKAGSQGLGGSTLIDLAGVAPPLVHQFVAKSLFATRLFNVTVTNVPGPQMPLYCFGSRMVGAYPLVPLAAEHAVAVAAFSFDGRITLGINADRESMADIAVMAEGMRRELAELEALASAQAAVL